ncbi:MAG: DnaA/Hda family protein [Planctomycetes bacterium]|nr:DnaA/Hda family protein [Planctomycetota bacterium]
MTKVWAAARARLQDELGWIRTRPWLDELALRSCEPAEAVLEAASAPARDQALAQQAAIARALAEVLGRPVPVRVVHRRSRAARPPKGAAEPAADEPAEVHLGSDRVSESFELSSFLTGPKNEVPLRFARHVVDAPGRYCPVVFYGESGTGKTHLLQGIVNGYRRRYPGRRVVYTSSDRFARQLSFMARKRLGGRFRELYREADLLVLEDVQDLAGKEASERELTFTLDHLQAQGRQVVLSSTCLPRHINYVERSLGDRLTGGLTVPLEPPDRETRLSIVKARTAALSLPLDDQVLELLTSGLEASVRELLCALTQLDAHRRHVGCRLDLPTVRRILSEMLRGRTEVASLDGVCDFVATRLGIGEEQLRGGSRRPQVARARQVAMALARELTGLTLREVGTFFGQRSCASVHAAQHKVAALRQEDPRIREVWEAACARFTREPAPQV